MANRLMELVANHGTGNDILALAKLLKGINPNVPYTPVTQIKHEEGNIYKSLGFTPSEAFFKMSQIETRFNGTMMTEFLEEVLQDQQLVEQMAIISVLLCKKMPAPLIGMALGGSPSDE